jgi:hypothetical protein
MGWVVNATPWPLYPLERPGTIVQEAEWDSEPVWTGAENLASTGIRSPDRPTPRQSLYRLSYPGSTGRCSLNKIYVRTSSNNIQIFLSSTYQTLQQNNHCCFMTSKSARPTEQVDWVEDSLLILFLPATSAWNSVNSDKYVFRDLCARYAVHMCAQEGKWVSVFS